MTKRKSDIRKINWNRYLGCQGYFLENSYFKILKNVKPCKITSSRGLMFTILEELDNQLLISPDMLNCSVVNKEFVLI